MDTELKDILSYKEKLDLLITTNEEKLKMETLTEKEAEILHKQLEKIEIRIIETKKKLCSRTKRPENFEQEMEKLSDTFLNLDLLQAQLEILFKVEKPKLEEKGECNSSSIKIDKLRIEKFNGNIFKFYEFWDQFEISIHENRSVLTIDKFKLLKSYLEGKALDKLAGINITVENYQTAIDILKKEYGNKKVLVEKHYLELTQMPMCNNYSANLRAMIDTIEKHIRCLENFGEDVKQRLFTTIIKGKFTPKFILEVEKIEPIDSIDAKKLIENIQKIVSSQERVYLMNNYKGTPFNTSNEHIHQEQNQSNFTTASLLTTSNKPKFTTMKCIYCSKEHWSDECNEYSTIESRKEKIKGGCFICLSKRHLLQHCPVDKPCFHCKISKNHHRSLCPKNTKTIENKRFESSLMAINEDVIMQTATLFIRDHKNQSTILTRLLLDSGSQRTYITESLRKRANLVKDETQILSVFTFGHTTPKQMKTDLTNLTIEFPDLSTLIIRANVVQQISGKLSASNNEKLNLNVTKDLEMADKNPTLPIEMLVGNDYYHEIVLNEKKEVLPGLYLINSKLGWILTGRYEYKKLPTEVMSLITYSEDDVTISLNEMRILIDDNDLKKLWDLDTIGIRDDPTVNGDDIAIKTFNDSIVFENGRYIVSWPWREFPPKLSNCYPLAFGRLKSIINTLRAKNLLLKYDEIIQDQLNKGIVEIVPTNEITTSSIQHYLPHHPVITPEKETTKLRIVYDGSAKLKKNENSLNDCLYRGKNMIEDLVGIILRFRMFFFIVMCDIEKAFLQIGLHKEDRDATRFLWLKDLTKAVTLQNLLILRFASLIFGAVSSPFLLNAVIRHRLNLFRHRLAKLLARNIYVDNVIMGFLDEKDVIEFYELLLEIFAPINMNLRQWCTNSQILRNTLPDYTQPTETTVLGILWNLTTDNIKIKTKVDLQISETMTKRTLVKIVASVFDPLGLICPILLQPKLLIQTLWKKNYEWDDLVANDDLYTWSDILENLKAIKSIEIPRNIRTTADSNVELHCFTDASKDAYAATLYLREVTGSTIHSHLAFAKLRLAPPKITTIPRLELLGVLIGIRCIKYIKNQLDVNFTNIFLWTDSQCVLHWINSTKILPVFVENRLKEIKSEKVIFKYVSTTHNPADWATRGKSVIELNSFWWNGPTWLSQPEGNWPLYHLPKIESTPEEELSPELFSFFNKTSPILEKNSEFLPPFDINASNYSTLKKLLRVTSYCVHFINKTRQIHSTPVEDFATSMVMWEHFIQRKHYEAVISDIVEGKHNILRTQLGLELDDHHILHCKGRIQNAFNDDSLFPKLLPANDHFTKLVVLDTHIRLFHVGVAHTLAEVRKNYWIPKGRTVVRTILRNCFSCKRFSVGPYKLPSMAPLPYARVTESLPFMSTGLDYLGPLYIKPNYSKVWICLFTCFTTRAIHLEVTSGLDSDEFLLALRRFIARRGKPKHITSDNAKQFKLTSDILSEVTWHFIPELAPWHGGFYERLVAMVKNCLRKTLLKSTLFASQLYTLVTEIEATLNSRPLLYVGDDIESNNLLTPSHFLSLRTIQTIGHFDEENYKDENYHVSYSTRKNLEDHWNKGQGYLNAFWKMWREEYLLSLMERSASKIKQPRVTSFMSPHIGDIVIVAENLPRARWRLAKVINLNISHDNEVRSALVKLPNGHLITRPLNLLYPLEINDHNPQEMNDFNSTQHPQRNTKELSHTRVEVVKPRRKAAENARTKISHLYDNNLV